MNTVHLVGRVKRVFMKDMKTWIRGSLLLEVADGSETWIAIQGLDKGKKETETLPELDKKIVLIEGYLSSYTPKAEEGKPPPTPRYELASTPKNIRELKGTEEELKHLYSTTNFAVVRGKVEEVKQAKSGVFFARLSVSYYKPSRQEFGTRLVRVQLPSAGKVPNPNQLVAVTGRVLDRDGIYVEATGFALSS